MKTSSFKQAWINIFLKPFIVLLLFVVTCAFFNFLLVPPPLSSIIETIMADAKNDSENIDMAFIGSSRTYRGIDTPTLSENLNKNIYNFAYENSNFFTSYHLLKEICLTNQLETLFLEVSITNFTRKDSTEDPFIYQTLSGNNKKEFAKGINLNYNQSKLLGWTNHLNNFSNGRFIKNIQLKFSNNKKIGSTINNANSIYKGNGFLYAKASAKNAALSLPASYFTEGKLWKDSFANEKQVKYFHKIMDYCNQENIEVVLYSPPYPYEISKDYQQDFTAYDEFLIATTSEYNVKLLDFSKIKKQHLKITNDLFYNSNHCNGKGAEKLEPIIEAVLRDIQNGNFSSSDWFYQSFNEMINDYSNI